MKRKTMMSDFVHGRCKAVKEPKKFVALWMKSKGNPCLVCDMDQSNCRYYKILVDRGAIIE